MTFYDQHCPSAMVAYCAVNNAVHVFAIVLIHCVYV